ncbi:multicopper oxidase domain-containing protein [Streptomyces sp. NPDC058232]|uniref:multicopper oxidase domain-containing protein n=1 Tax=Streptomyces sp. NPDC058232 TaxID=3346393 RepID=UPI0036EC6232
MDRRSFNRRMLVGGAAVATSMSLAPEAAAAPRWVKTAPAGGKERHIKLFAEQIGRNQMGYGIGNGKATIPGPLIEMNEGDTLYVEFENRLHSSTGLHVHGVDYSISNDGTRLTRSLVKPGHTRTYVWRAHAPGRRADGTWQEGSAGYWHYHDHAVGSDHGTGGVSKGLYGGLVVRRQGDILPDKAHTLVFNGTTINNGNGHAGPDIKATVGERVEFVMITHGNDFHTFHLHGHRWASNRTGLLTGPDDPSELIDTRVVGPGTSFGFQVIAGETSGAGAWMYHCHVQRHSDKGMAGLFLVRNTDGTIPRYDDMVHRGH